MKLHLTKYGVNEHPSTGRGWGGRFALGLLWALHYRQKPTPRTEDFIERHDPEMASNESRVEPANFTARLKPCPRKILRMLFGGCFTGWKPVLRQVLASMRLG